MDDIAAILAKISTPGRVGRLAISDRFDCLTAEEQLEAGQYLDGPFRTIDRGETAYSPLTDEGCQLASGYLVEDEDA